MLNVLETDIHNTVHCEAGMSLNVGNENGQISSDDEIDVLVVNTFERDGGAARAAYRIFSEIRRHSLTVRYLTLTKEDPDPHISGRLRTSAIGMLAERLARLDRIPNRFYPRRQQVPFSPNFWPNPLRIPLKHFKPKLIHLHWLGAGLLRVEELAQVACPIVWTLHDAWAFTGGCHYTQGCEGFKKLCGCCPQLGSPRENDHSRYLMQRKTRAFQDLDITVVTPSWWLAEMAGQSSLFEERRIVVIPNGLDTEVFKPIERSVARELLGIQSDSPVVLFGTISVADPRKGWDLLCDALRYVKEPLTLLVFGDGKAVVEHAPHVTVRQLGSFPDDKSLALVYSAADVFVCPSREDNLPNTVAEALACGTPCVAFATGGLPDMIKHKQNGWLARPFDSADLAQGIDWVIRHHEQDQLRLVSRDKAVTDYSMAVMGNRYMALYGDVLKLR